MSMDDCAALVEAGDPDRFAATMAAPPPARRRLWPLYAANLEIARAPWASSQPMVAEMRLQWWIDTIAAMAEGQDRAGHPVTNALFPLIAERPGIAPLLVGVAEARRWDCWTDPFADEAALDAYLDATAGGLMWAAALSLGAAPAAEPVVRDFAFGAGLAQWFMAAPTLEARGRLPFSDGRPEALAALAIRGRAQIASARRRRHLVGRGAIPALWTGFAARPVLRQVAAEPGRVAAGALHVTDFTRRGGLLLRAATGYF